MKRLALALIILRCCWRHYVRRAKLTAGSQSHDVCVSLTSYGHRLPKCWLAMESIGLGQELPTRLILWLDEQDQRQSLPRRVRRLQARGLEVAYGERIGPHAKYYHYVSKERNPLALVTADDDILYPRDWLSSLLRSFRAMPEVIHCFRAYEVVINGDRLADYRTWPLARGTEPSRKNFLTGVSGVIYPTRFLEYLREAGTAFLSSCPKADDVWLNVCALRAGVPVALVANEAIHFPLVPGTQGGALYAENGALGGNDVQIRATYRRADVHVLQSSP